MKLSDFKIKISENPWNSMDSYADKEFQEKRDKQVKNWRDIVYKSIDLGNNPDAAEKIPDDHFEHGKIDDKKEKEEQEFCDSCGTALDDDRACFICKDKTNKKKEK